MVGGAGGVSEDASKGKRKRNSAYIQETVKEEPKRTRVQAQRKFAQGAGGVSPIVSPLKEIRNRSKNDTNGSSSSSSASSTPFPGRGERPKTEDFLTFLCLRGTDNLPPELDFFNQASASQNNDSSDECFSDQDDVDKDPEVDKNGVARKSSRRLSAINANSKPRKEAVAAVKKGKDQESGGARQTRAHSQDSQSRQTRSQGSLRSGKSRGDSSARKVVNGVESSDESLSDPEDKTDEVEADEEASSRESSRRPERVSRKVSDETKNKSKDALSRLKQREARSTSRDSSVSSVKTTTSKSKEPKQSKEKPALKENKALEKVEVEKDEKEETSKSPKDKRDAKKKHKNKSKTSLKDLQNSLLAEAKRKIAGDGPAVVEDSNHTSESSKRPSTSPGDSDTPDSEERITISQKNGYISVKPRGSIEQLAEERSEAVSSPQRRNSGPLAGPGGKKISKAGERVPTPPRKILPKNEGEECPVSTASTNHLPVGVIGAAGLSNRLTRPVALTKSSPVTSASLSQPLVIQTTSSSQSKPVMTVASVSAPTQPTIIVPAGPGPLQMSAVPLHMRPVGASSVQSMGIPIMTPAGMQYAVPVGPGGVIRPQQQAVVTVPTFIRSGYGYSQPIVAGSVQQPGQIPAPQTITMPSGTTIQYNVPSNSIKQTNQQPSKLSTGQPSTPPPSVTPSTFMMSSSSPLVSPGPPTLSPQIPGPARGSTTVTRTGGRGGEPPVLTPPVREEESQARRELLPSPHPQPLYHLHSPASSYHSPPALHSPGYHSQYLQTSHSPQLNPVEPPALHSPLTHSSAGAGAKKQNRTTEITGRSNTKDDSSVKSDRSESSESSSSSSQNPSKKKSGDKIMKTKQSGAQNRTTKTFDIEDNSSPYAFDFENPDSSPSVPFRKSSSPLKPAAMIKKTSQASTKNKQQQEQKQTTHADLKPTGSKNKSSESQKSPKLKAELEKKKDQVLVQCDVDTNEVSGDDSKVADNPEDTSSSDNETTYFIPLKDGSGKSFGVSLKLGTDGPCGPNQKVIMTAKLVTDSTSQPQRAKILGAKTTETRENVPARESQSPEQSTSTPIKQNPALTPRKMMIPNSSPVTEEGKSRIRRALSPELSQPSPVKESFTPGTGKRRPMCLIGQVNTGHRFPRLGQHAQMMEAPTFRPTEAEFKDPLRYIQKIRGYAEQFGMCKIIPPSSFKPECNVDDDMRFTAYNQYINRMMNRAGPNSKETAAIKKYLETQNCDTRNHPLVGGLEVDLPALYHAVQSFGGLSEVIQKKKWNKIADYLRVARGTNVNAAGNKLDDIYVKWLLPYDTLSDVERQELIRLVEEEWAEKAEKSRVKEEVGSDNEDEEEEDEEEDDEEDQEAVVKGKSTSLAQFYRVAKNLMSSIFRSEDPPHHIIEDEYWKIVSDKDVHMQVCQGSIDTGNEGYGFPIRNSNIASHPWNLKQLTNNPRSVLRAMGKVMGVTQPTLHVGMLFTTGCWYRDPHGLPWVEFLHTGAPKIWYGIPDDHSLAFYTAMKQLVPAFCKNRKIWLPSDTTMVSPSYLVRHGVSVCRAIQHPGQFVVVFPRSYTSSLSTGYNVSESVYYAPKQWLAEVEPMFQDIRDSQEPMMFPLEKILFALATDAKSTKYVLELIKPKIEKIKEKESDMRKKLLSAGLKVNERLKLENKSSADAEDDEYECYVCNANLYVSLVANEHEEVTYCLPHGLEYLKENKSKVKQCKLLYTHTMEEIRDILKKVEERLRTKNYFQDQEDDKPLKEEDIIDIEDADYVDEDDLKPRDRALPSYIKKEKKPLISSESEEEEEEDNQEDEDESEEDGPKITADDYLEDDVDPAVIAALFAEDDEIVRPSGKRKAPKERKLSESSDSSVEEEARNQKRRDDNTKRKKDVAKAKADVKAKAKEVAAKKALKDKKLREKEKEKEKEKMKSKSAEPSKASKRKLDESPSSSKQNPKKKSKETPSTSDRKQVKDKKTEIENKSQKSQTNSKSSPRKVEDPKKKTPVKETKNNKKPSKAVSKVEPKGKELRKKEESKKPTMIKFSKEEKPQSRRKESSREERGKQRKSKKRKAKSMDAADKFNLLDIILTETDDENYCSVSENDSEDSSSDDEWK